ncbi:hypothetical protein [Chamaesiphon minutus]|uniref:PsbP n=1 Tax=Chamaesiphon minutus (strain ATCC 27169 / PCC 6605) TaxID=1173020 RepID=K9UJH8_CHAP6|nr:hypothetical protein [Chamaesiphon minutus]AFY94788.1 hypothetical protein Cha6605_3817 [Chamaesiphon minutus PCC 6605]
MKSTFSRIVIASTLIFGLALPIQAQVEGGSGKASGDNHNYALTAPKGWAIDSEAMRADGVPLVFYPANSSWANSQAVIYTRPMDRGNKIRNTQDVVNNLVTNFHNNGHPNYRASFKNNLKIGDKLIVKIYWFSGDRYGNHEAVAYIEEAKTINFIVLNARNIKAFQDGLPAFTEIVKSYRSQ